MKKTSLKQSPVRAFLAGWFLVLVSTGLIAGERSLIQLRDFRKVEVKGAGFSLDRQEKIHLRALGCGKKRDRKHDSSTLFAYGWILNADTRDLVWEMTEENSAPEGKNRSFEGTLTLPAGSYEVYYAAYGYEAKSGFGNIEMNVDRRNILSKKKIEKDWGPFSWFYGFFTDDFYKEWEKNAMVWGIDVSVDDPENKIETFNVPKEIPAILFKTVKLGEQAYIKQGFTLGTEMKIRVYAFGEKTPGSNEFADYGWIVNTRAHKRVWEMTEFNARHAGGGEKNWVVDEVITLPPGEYMMMYITDDSHSYLDWNEAPPYDPFNYGITLAAVHEGDKNNFALSNVSDLKNIIVELTRIGDDEMRSATFTLKNETDIRIYALGERSLSNREMADYGWIINAKTRERVWTMEADRSEHAGGSSKNRVVDEVITLPRGTYTVYYKTDDSHSYNDWNSDPPLDQKRWGITIMGEGEKFAMTDVERNITPKRTGIIAQITEVGDDEDRTVEFTLDRPTRVRIYALGEGQNREMFDYGSIENVRTGATEWEMTYGITFHAGGARKNRMVNTSILLEKGEYRLQYRSDDSHSYNDWNSDPPEDPTMWGITLYKDEK